MAKRGYTVVTYAKDQQERMNNIIFVEKLRDMLDVLNQTGKEKKIASHFDTNMARWINSSKGTVLIFTPSFAENTWMEIFKGHFTYDARTKAKQRFIPVVMPPYQRSDLKAIFGETDVISHDPVVFGLGWESELSMQELVNIDTECIDPQGEQINLVEFRTCKTRGVQSLYAIRNRTPPGKEVSQVQLFDRHSCFFDYYDGG